ncbi:putative cyclic di-GMP phosphodiesterase [Abditibacteriota bacterium]|nr:putative cyclic di-GMP phosphodiesterase [Abditibacteriota bacterium]
MKFLQECTILIVEDQDFNIQLLHNILSRDGYTNIVCVQDSREAIERYNQSQPDLVFLDLHMPHLDGFGVLEQLQDLTHSDYVPILILTADTNPQARQCALSLGAMDFINKPFKISEVLLRTRNFLHSRQMHLQLKSKNQLLEKLVLERTRLLEEAQIEMLERLANAAEYRDQETGEHTNRVSWLSAHIARKIGMSEWQVSLLRRAATLHDIGKIAVPDKILLKPGPLTPTEFEIMQTHTKVGAHLLKNGHSHVIKMAESIALTHHEKWDGTGHPQGLKGEEIPLEGRIVALVDVFDALSHERPYKKAWSHREVVSEIKAQSGRHFDPAVVEAFLHLEAEPNFEYDLPSTCKHACA